MHQKQQTLYFETPIINKDHPSPDETLFWMFIYFKNIHKGLQLYSICLGSCRRTCDPPVSEHSSVTICFKWFSVSCDEPVLSVNVLCLSNNIRFLISKSVEWY